MVPPWLEANVYIAAGASTDGGTTVNTTYNIAAGTYTYSITGFGAGDVWASQGISNCGSR